MKMQIVYDSLDVIDLDHTSEVPDYTDETYPALAVMDSDNSLVGLIKKSDVEKFLDTINWKPKRKKRNPTNE
jgi:predicted transcriptional regulator